MEARRSHQAEVEIRSAKQAVRLDNVTDILQLHSFDQLCHLNQLLVELRQPLDETTDAFLNYTRAQLRKREDYQAWQQDTEWSQQLNKYEIQNMFGAPIPRPFLAIDLSFVWTYLMKEAPLLLVSCAENHEVLAMVEINARKL